MLNLPSVSNFAAGNFKFGLGGDADFGIGQRHIAKFIFEFIRIVAVNAIVTRYLQQLVAFNNRAQLCIHSSAEQALARTTTIKVNQLFIPTDDRYAVLALLNVFFLVIGMFLHSAAAIILVVPIVVPLISHVGIDPVHFGVIVTLNLAIGQQTPPVASVLVTACSVARAAARWR